MDGSTFDAPRTDVIAEQTGAELRQFIERIEALEAEKADIGESIKEVFAELKGRGYLVMPVRTIIKERRKDPDARAEEQAILESYKAALGMA